MHPKLIAICSAAFVRRCRCRASRPTRRPGERQPEQHSNGDRKDLNVNVSQIPVNAQVPIGIGANVCGVDANVLAAGAAHGAVAG